MTKTVDDAYLTALSLVRNRAACTGTMPADEPIVMEMIETYDGFARRHGVDGLQELVASLALVATTLLGQVSQVREMDETAVLDELTLAARSGR
ncbi:hypothetical protein [Amycolatopsis sp. NBC_01480]|uniref:hypothetical protein n=1 Tax=Amycolatopsis sp. NBC_01480 TaxID=2903562 RepID=UPI002E2BFEA0|nr:hypothetical protein [Amycolatopsis sp. NBC_01480]